MNDYARLTFEQTKAGLHWARDVRGEWGLVEIRMRDTRRIYVMGWDCDCDPQDYDHFVRVDLVTPDGKPYKT